jgi:hypothetical protein
MNGDTPISGKSMVGESVVEESRKWVGEVFQDGLFSVEDLVIAPANQKSSSIGDSEIPSTNPLNTQSEPKSAQATSRNTRNLG